MSLNVVRVNGKISVVIPSEYKEPDWLDRYYKDYTKNDDGSITIPCRLCNVDITKPILQQTNIGVVRTNQTIQEQWYYFDVPGVSALAYEGDDLLKIWSEEDLKLERKEEITQNKEDL